MRHRRAWKHHCKHKPLLRWAWKDRAASAKNIIGYKHSRYANQPNEVNNALWGAALGAGAGQAIGHDTESTVYGAATGILGGYYGSKLIR